MQILREQPKGTLYEKSAGVVLPAGFFSRKKAIPGIKL
jgi:hypothetical protein